MQPKSKTYRTANTRQRPVRIYHLFDQWIESRVKAQLARDPDSKANFSRDLNRILNKAYRLDRRNRNKFPFIPVKFM